MMNVECGIDGGVTETSDLEPSAVSPVARHRQAQGATQAALSASRHDFIIDSIINKLI